MTLSAITLDDPNIDGSAQDQFCRFIGLYSTAAEIARLCNAKQTSSGWLGHCPAHDDSHQSLSIREADDGKVLLHCHAGCITEDICARLGMTLGDLFPNGNSYEAIYDYEDEQGNLLYQVVRKTDKTFLIRHQDDEGEWVWGAQGIRKVLYRLPKVIDAINRGGRIFIVEGEKDVGSLEQRGFCATTNQGGAGKGKWNGLYTKTLQGAEVIILPDNDDPGSAHAERVANSLHGVAASVKVVNLPRLPQKGDVSDWIQAGGTQTEFEALIENAQEWVPTPEQSTNKNETQTQKLIQLESQIELFKTPEGNLFARVPVNGHHEVLAIKERGSTFRQWLGQEFFKAHGKPPSNSALSDATAHFAGKAQFNGDIREVFTRVAWHKNKLYLDLCNEEREVVVIDENGWKVTQDYPVFFSRPKGMCPLPTPEPGGDLKRDLCPLLNVPDDDDWILIAGWLVGMLLPDGPLPHLCIHGEQGSAKSTATKILRSCIDPNKVIAGNMSKEERDLLIAAKNGLIVGLENLSHLPSWLSDALCRLSTGAGFRVRKLYTDDEETLIEVRRPVILNGITEVAVRGDLIDRCIFITLPKIVNRRDEKDVWKDFDDAHPKILGAILDAVSMALKNRDSITIDPAKKPRMVDFARWVEGASDAVGWQPEEFLTAYLQNRNDSSGLQIEASPFISALVEYLDKTGDFEEKTAGEIEKVLANQLPVGRPPQGWPKNARSAGIMLRRAAPALEARGYDMTIPPKSQRKFTIKNSHRKPAQSGTSATQHDPDDDLENPAWAGRSRAQMEQGWSDMLHGGMDE